MLSLNDNYAIMYPMIDYFHNWIKTTIKIKPQQKLLDLYAQKKMADKGLSGDSIIIWIHVNGNVV